MKRIGWSDLSRGISTDKKKDETTNKLFLNLLLGTGGRVTLPFELKIPRQRELELLRLARS